MHITRSSKSAPLLGALCFVPLLSLNVAHAELISQDSAFGVDTITLDTDTNLQWLDVDLTANRSFDDVAAQLGPGGEFEGFRHATVDEIMTLWVNAGIPDILTGEGPPMGDDFTEANLAPVLALIDLIGITLSNPVLTLSEGFSADAPPGDPTLRIVGELNVCINPQICMSQGITPDTALASLGPNQDATDIASDLVGHYLVQDSLFVASPDPGVAGMVNSWTATGATPNGFVLLFVGLQDGATPFPFPPCPGTTVDIQGAFFFGFVRADGSGMGTIMKQVPPVVSGRNIRSQVVDLTTCSTSNVDVTLFQ